MLIIEKNEIYENIKKEENKKNLFEDLTWISSFFSIVYIVSFIGSLFKHDLNNESIFYFLFFLVILIFLICLTFKSIRTLYKSYKYIEYGKKELNKIYAPDIFLKISEELILLDKNKNISLINKDFLDKILNHKKENSTITEKLSILKKVSQSIENN